MVRGFLFCKFAVKQAKMRVEGKPKKEVLVSEKLTVHDVNLLDCSGSMKERGKYDSSVEGINEEAKILKREDSVNYLVTRVEFDSNYNQQMSLKWHERATPIHNCSTFEGKGAHGGTPLYQAVATVIKEMLTIAKPGEKVLLKIQTDGEENSSQDGWSRSSGGASRLADLIKKVEAENGFTVTFIGTKMDIESMVKEVGLRSANTYVHQNTGDSIKMSSRARATATVMYSRKASRGEDVLDNFYEKSVEGDK